MQKAITAAGNCCEVVHLETRREERSSARQTREIELGDPFEACEEVDLDEAILSPRPATAGSARRPRATWRRLYRDPDRLRAELAAGAADPSIGRGRSSVPVGACCRSRWRCRRIRAATARVLPRRAARSFRESGHRPCLPLPIVYVS